MIDIPKYRALILKVKLTRDLVMNKKRQSLPVDVTNQPR